MERHTLEVLGGKIDWKNFAGAERSAMVNGRMQIVNAEGKRGFAAIIDPMNSEVYFDGERITDPDFGQQLSEMGFKVSIRPARDEGGVATYRLPVEIRYPDEEHRDNTRYIPQIYMVTGASNRQLLDPEDLHLLDGSDVVKANYVITNSTGHDRNTGEEYAKTWCNEGYFWINRTRVSSFFDDMEMPTE